MKNIVKISTLTSMLCFSATIYACSDHTVFYNDTDEGVKLSFTGSDGAVVDVPAHGQYTTADTCTLNSHGIASIVSDSTQDKFGFDHQVVDNHAEFYHIHKMPSYSQTVDATGDYNTFKTAQLTKVNNQAVQIQNVRSQFDSVNKEFADIDTKTQEAVDANVSVKNQDFVNVVNTEVDKLLTKDKLDQAVASYRQQAITNTALSPNEYYISAIENSVLSGSPAIKITAANNITFSCGAGDNDGPAYIKMTTELNKNTAAVLKTAYSSAKIVEINKEDLIPGLVVVNGESKTVCFIKSLSVKTGV